MLFSHRDIFSQQYEISIRNKEPEGYQLRYYILRFAGHLSWSITIRLLSNVFKFALLSEYAAESEKLLIVSGSGKQGVPEQVH